MGVEMKWLIAGALIGCAAVVLVAWMTIRHLNNKQEAEWCHEHGYTNYATKDGFCVGAGGKLIRVGG
jgi:DhnA family fructose-bisphosphate aldolase class Ia